MECSAWGEEEEEEQQQEQEKEQECVCTNLEYVVTLVLDNFSFHQLLKAVTPIWENSFWSSL